MKILSFLATEEGQNLLIEDDLGIVPATRGAAVPDDPLLENIIPEIESGRYIVRPVYNMLRPVLETQIAAYIRGETTSKDILEQCRMIQAGGIIEEESFGYAEDNFTVLQTGQLKADALREATAADIALIGMAEADHYNPVAGTRAKLYKGEITANDLLRIAQILSDEPLLCSRAELTGEELLEILESGAFSAEEQKAGAVSHFHPFAVSGISLTYHLNETEGSRATNVKMEGGGALEPGTIYTVAFLEDALPPEFCAAAEKTDISMKDALQEYTQVRERVTPDTRRIRLQ